MSNPIFLFQKMQVFYDSYKFERGAQDHVEYLTQVIREDPDNDEAWAHLGYAYEKLKEIEKARNAFSHVRQVKYMDDFHLAHGRVFMVEPKPNFRFAMKQFLSAAEERPFDVEVLYRIMDCAKRVSQEAATYILEMDNRFGLFSKIQEQAKQMVALNDSSKKSKK